VKPVEPTKPVKPVEPTKPVQPVKPVEPTKPVQPVKPVQPTKPIANNPVKPAPGSVKKPISVDPAKAPKPGQKLTPPKQIVQHKGPSELDNKRSVANFARSKSNMTIVRNNVQINKAISLRQTNFSNRYYGDIRDRGGRYGGYYRDFGWHNYYHGFWGYGFFGGFYYPFRPCFGIADYFFYPALYWLYVDAIEDAFYLAWYPNYYYGNPITPFPYVGVWYPTEELVDMGVEVSAQPDIAQDNFRQGMTLLTQALTQQIANNLDASVTLGTNEIVVTHYQNLQDTAYAMDGFVDSPSLNLHVAFKALVDMSDPSKSMVFVPTGAQPTPADDGILNMINQRIIALGGDPMIADVETDVASSQ